MQFSHFTFPVGGSACNAKCPFCVSRMTGNTACSGKAPEVNWDRFRTACKIAERSPGLNTALLTGVGEPTLYPNLVTTYLEALRRCGGFPIVEMQTNGILLADDPLIGEKKMDRYLKDWKRLGLETICLSAVSQYQGDNAEIYGGEHYPIDLLVRKLHSLGYTVRLCIMLVRNYTDTLARVGGLIHWSHECSVDHLTARPIRIPDTSYDAECFDWTSRHIVPQETLDKIVRMVEAESTLLLELAYGAKVYAYRVDGGEQNVCLSNCLTETTNTNEIRQLICWPDGRIGYSWAHPAARIL